VLVRVGVKQQSLTHCILFQMIWQ